MNFKNIVASLALVGACLFASKVSAATITVYNTSGKKICAVPWPSTGHRKTHIEYIENGKVFHFSPLRQVGKKEQITGYYKVLISATASIADLQRRKADESILVYISSKNDKCLLEYNGKKLKKITLKTR